MEDYYNILRMRIPLHTTLIGASLMRSERVVSLGTGLLVPVIGESRVMDQSVSYVAVKSTFNFGQ